LQKIEGRVSRVLFQNAKNYYTIMIFRDAKDDKSYSVVGYFPIIHPFLRVSIYGQWKSHKKHGKQFEASSYEILEPKNENELLEFISGDIIGCPYPVAFEITKKLGLSYLSEYDNFAALKNKLTPREGLDTALSKSAEKLTIFYKRIDMLKALSAMGFEQSLASKMVFSENPPKLDEIRKNPYLLIKRYDLKWKDMDEIALKNGIGKKSATRMEQGILYLLEEASNSYAHMYLPQNTLEREVQKFLNISFDVASLLDIMENENKVVRDLKDRVYSGENYRLEKTLAINLYRISKSDPIVKKKPFKINMGGFPYSTDQFEAIELALNEQLCIISGPAGTGKTTIVLKMIEELKKMGYHLQLCAPTGRAAKRMTEVTGMEAKTCHHILGFNPETKLPTFNNSTPLYANCFIIDEASMLDIKIASYLLDAIPSGSKVIIIGDEHQLPSIGPGTVLKDLLECNFFPTKRLEQVFRQGKDSFLLDFATKIRNGIHLPLDSMPKKTDFKFLELKNHNSIKEAIKKLVAGFVKLGKYNVFDDLQIISPIHNGPIGVKELNALVQDIVNPNPKDEILYGNKLFRTGDKVIQMHNNYDKKIYNGDIGKIHSINKKSKSILVDINGERIEYIGEELFELDLAYVLTVHKVQGGEYPFVIMPFHPSFGRMVNRKLLYTASTRAKTQFVVISDETTIQKAIDSNEDELRYCNLIGRLKEARLKKIFTQ